MKLCDLMCGRIEHQLDAHKRMLSA